MRRLLQFSAATGGGVFLVSVMSLGALGAFTLALIVVGCGWLLFGAAQLSPELGRAGRFAGSVALAGLRLRRFDDDTPAEDDAADVAEVEPDRWAVVHEGDKPARLLKVRGTPNHVARCRSFVLLGDRLGGYKSRDLEGRRLSTGEIVDFSLWRRVTDDLVHAGLMTKDKKNGAQLRLPVRDVLARLEGAELPSAPLRGEIVTDPAEGWQAVRPWRATGPNGAA